MRKSRIEGKKQNRFGENMSFESQEAFNLLRANLTLSFPDEKRADASGCHIIGITSALRGDGKSYSAINCAYNYAVTNKRVLLVECDLRLPTISDSLEIARTPGLSNYLVGQCERSEIIRECKLHENIRVIVSGDTPPNPSGLLSSSKMTELLSGLRNSYDIIIMDMPPVDAVSDALVLSHLLDGIVVVVRHNYTDCGILLKTMRQLEFAEIRVLGFILNDYSEYASGYYKRYEKKYKRYGQYYKNHA